MSSIKINSSAVLTAYKNADVAGKKLLEDLVAGQVDFSMKITDRIKTFEDACAEVGFVPSSNNIAFGFADDKDMISINAYSKLCIIARALNEGWTPDWSDSNQYKYYPWFDMSSGSGLAFGGYGNWRSGSGVGSRLCFLTSEDAKYAGTKFKDLYEEYFILK